MMGCNDHHFGQNCRADDLFKGGNMRLGVFLIMVIALSGCMTSQKVMIKDGVTVSRKHDQNITEACATSRNILTMSKSQIRDEFGAPQEKLPSPKDRSGETELLKYYSSSGRLMEVYVKNDKVVDVNYTASAFGVGEGGGRRERERQWAQAQTAIETAAAKEIPDVMREEQKNYEDAFLEKEGIVIEKKDVAIVAYMNGTEDGKGTIYQEEDYPEEDDVKRAF
jgi:hypothetical protein